MKEHMKYIADDAEKLLKVQAQVVEVKNIMMGNIDEVNHWCWVKYDAFTQYCACAQICFQGYMYSVLTICIYVSIYMHCSNEWCQYFFIFSFE